MDFIVSPPGPVVFSIEQKGWNKIMLRKTVTYYDDEGNEITKNCYFNLTQAEIVDDEFGGNSGESFVTILRRMTNEKDSTKIVQFVKKIMLASYGKKTESGGFIKNAAIREEFAASQEYSELFFEICRDTNSIADFVNGIVSKSMLKEAERLQKEGGSRTQNKINEFIKTGDYSALNEDNNNVNKGENTGE